MLSYHFVQYLEAFYFFLRSMAYTIKNKPQKSVLKKGKRTAEKNAKRGMSKVKTAKLRKKK